MPEGTANVLLNKVLQRLNGGLVEFCSFTIVEPIAGRRGPGVTPFQANLASTDRPRRNGWVCGHRFPSADDTVPEHLFRFEQLQLIEPISRDLDQFVLVVSKDHGQKCPFDTGN